MSKEDKRTTQHIFEISARQKPPSHQGDDYLEYQWEPTVTHYDNGLFMKPTDQERQSGIAGYFIGTQTNQDNPETGHKILITVYTQPKDSLMGESPAVGDLISTDLVSGEETRQQMEGKITIDETRLPGPNNFNLTHTQNKLVHMGLPPSGEFDI